MTYSVHHHPGLIYSAGTQVVVLGDVDRRGCNLLRAEQHWSLSGVPDRIEIHETQEAYWELQ